MTTTLQEIKPSAIKPHKHNPRHDVGDVEELAASIAEQGLLEPLIVAPNGTGDTYTLIAGHRRLAAAKSKRLKTVPCLVRDDLTDPAAQLEVMLVENLQRSDLTPLEEAEAYQLLLEFPGYTQTKIASATGRAIATVRARLKMTKLPKSALAKIHAGQMSLAHAQALTDFAEDRHFKDLEAAAGTDRFPFLLQRAKDERSTERRRERTSKELTAAGVRVVNKPDWRNMHAQFHGEDAIEEHRGCEGFAAYLDWDGRARYVCDRPDLHAGEDAAEDRDDAGEARMREREELRTKLVAAAKVRRAHLGVVLFRDSDDIEGIALDVLRQWVLLRGKGLLWLGDVLGCDWSDGKARTFKVGTLDLAQLALLVDFIDKGRESGLDNDYGWGIDGYSDTYKSWRTRLTDVYGYRWSPDEQALLDLAEQRRAARLSGSTDVGDDGDADLDEVADFDEDPAWDQEG